MRLARKSREKKWVNLLPKKKTPFRSLPKFLLEAPKNPQVSKISLEISMILTLVNPLEKHLRSKNLLLKSKNKLTSLILDKVKRRSPKKMNLSSNNKTLKQATLTTLKRTFNKLQRRIYVIMIFILVSSDFATNVYRANNNYLDLLDSKADSSNTWGQ